MFLIHIKCGILLIVRDTRYFTENIDILHKTVSYVSVRQNGIYLWDKGRSGVVIPVNWTSILTKYHVVLPDIWSNFVYALLFSSVYRIQRGGLDFGSPIPHCSVTSCQRVTYNAIIAHIIWTHKMAVANARGHMMPSLPRLAMILAQSS